MVDTIRLHQHAAERPARTLTIAKTLPPENLVKVFEPLFTTKSRGIGLGLAVCQNLVQLNEGTIELASEVGRGTTFTIWLPVEEAPG